MSVDSDMDMDESMPTSVDRPHSSKSHPSPSQEVAHSMLNRIKDQRTRSLLLSNVFCHLRNLESRFLENEHCMKAIEVATAEIEHFENTQPDESTASPPGIPKETAKKLVARMFYFLVWCIPSLLIFSSQSIMILTSSRAFGSPSTRTSLWPSLIYWKYPMSN